MGRRRIYGARPAPAAPVQGVGVVEVTATPVTQAWRISRPQRSDFTPSWPPVESARRAVEAMGGRIWAEPRAGRGAELCFRLGDVLSDTSMPAPA